MFKTDFVWLSFKNFKDIKFRGRERPSNYPLITILLFLSFCSVSNANKLSYDRNIAQWQEVAIPPWSDKGSRMVWDYAANYSELSWSVFKKDGQVLAQLNEEIVGNQSAHPNFTPLTKEFSGASTFFPVNNGWLIGFNHGEFGAALYWFSRNGRQHYKISNHQIVNFFITKEGIQAIEGLAHMGMSTGSVIRITRPKKNSRWHASTITQLPFAPLAISLKNDGVKLITLSDCLVSLDTENKVQTLLYFAPWDSFYPNSSVLSQDEQKLFIGMRQFVGEFDLNTKKLRLLVPSKEFLNKLPKDDEDRIRKTYGSE